MIREILRKGHEKGNVKRERQKKVYKKDKNNDKSDRTNVEIKRIIILFKK